MSFQDFELLPEVVQGVQAMGYTDPTPIQLRAIPAILAGKDVMRDVIDHRKSPHEPRDNSRGNQKTEKLQEQRPFHLRIDEAARISPERRRNSWRDIGCITDGCGRIRQARPWSRTAEKG